MKSTPLAFLTRPGKSFRAQTRSTTMPRISSLLLLAAYFCCLGCQSVSPENQAMWQKYHQIKPGMTRSQVLAILPPTGTVQRASTPGDAMEVWRCSSSHPDVKTGVAMNFISLCVTYGPNGRVKQADREVHSLKAGILFKP
ncbi:MAG: hypothetical protein P4N60_20120 [Verrucomicrobiae bacterium]|nr:hypothetical protein [Verrucomicrobiae bacterium]